MEIRTLNENSLLIYPYENPPYEAVEMRHIGPEPVKDLEVWLVSTDKNNVTRRQRVEQFFRQDDFKMIGHHFKANVLQENEIARFHLVKSSSTADAKVTVEAHFVGAKTGKAVKVTKDFELTKIVLG